jgi:choline dehydrogenase-like flavoprotein
MTELFDACIIGSGPAGVFAAVALLEQGKKTLMLDTGVSPPSEVSRLKSRMLASNKAEWSSEDLSKMSEGVEATAKGVAVKRHFGSNYPYVIPDKFPQFSRSNAECVPSFARGGFSTVWGAAVLPYRERDLKGWPIQENDLAPHYRSVLAHAKLSGAKDGLGSKFPLYGEDFSNLKISSQADFLEKKMGLNSLILKESGIESGRARVLFNRSDDASKECVRCGLCLYGCPKDIFFCSENILDSLKKNPLFTYKTGCYVDQFQECEESVSILSLGLAGNVDQQFKAKRLFIGAGVLPTAVLVLKSLKKEMKLTLLDSQYFLQPFLINSLRHDVLREELMTCAQLFVEIENETITPQNIHLQLYTYSAMIQAALQSKFPFPLSWIPARVRSRLLGMVGVIQGYLHSDCSGQMSIDFDSSSNTLSVQGKSNEMSIPTIKRSMSLLRKNSTKTGIFPIPGTLQVTAPGRGFHCGGTFPMSHRPSGNQSDVWGRPFGLKRVHLVDSSTFPTVPAATVTLTTMANSHRIASGSHEN